MKKIALFLLMALCLSLVTPFAVSAEIIPVEFEVLSEKPKRTPGVDCYEVLENTSFEVLDSPTQLYFWGFTSFKGAKNTHLGDELSERTEDAHSGDYALKVKVPEEGKNNDLICGVALKPGGTYEYSVWFKRLSGGNGGNVHILFTGTNKGIPQEYDRVRIPLSQVKAGDDWTQASARFVCPDYVTQASVCLRYNGPGEVVWDDVSLLHITDEMPKPDMAEAKESLKQLNLKNAGFEEDAAGQNPNPANGWEFVGDAKITSEYARNGKNSLALRISPGQTDAEVYTTISGFEKGATYQMSGWILNPEETKVQPSFWLNYSSLDYFDWADVNTQLGQEKQHWELRKNGDWQQFVYEFTPPDNAKSAVIEIRLRMTPGVYYADDISVYMVKAPYPMLANTDETFYYSEWKTGSLTANPYVLADPVNSVAEFSFIGLGGEEIHKETVKDVSNGVTYTFRTEWMAEKGKRYHVRLRLYSADGTVLQEQDFPVFRFDRPTYLGADGIFRKNGKEYTFTFGPGVRMELLAKNPEEGGVTVVQLLSDDSGLNILQKMDKAHEKGLLVLINLYGRTSDGRYLAAGSEDRIDVTKDTVEAVKDHPALFGYKIQDEPYQKGHTDEEMIRSYEIVRNIDPHHPVYIADSVPGGFPWLFRYCDILDIDYYGGNAIDAGRVLTDVMDQALVASKGQKPFSLVEQAFTDRGYMPSMDVMRHLAYQTFFSGGIGYTLHSLGTDGADPDPTPLMDRPIWKEICTEWAGWERDFMYDCFVTGKNAFVNYIKTDDVLWGTFTDGTDIYAICLNRNKNTPTTATIPMTDGTGKVLVENYIAKRMTGKDDRFIGTGPLNLSLEPMEAAVWKITPNGSSLDVSHLKSSKYKDLFGYTWAYNAVAILEEKGIVNEKAPNLYAPGENITRGDYAMFLVRTLGLTGSGENFADVDPTAEYAKELAIGKACGVLNGVGDNKFNPEAEITRQDMMTMTSRAMKLQGSADLSAFSDNGVIADYAKAHISAMVAEGLIKGNADGTINPLGNTTRAEAAVIMNRIITK